MPIREIRVSEHKVPYGRNSQENTSWKEKIHNIINTVIQADLRKVDIYNLNGDKQHHQAGDQNRLIIYANAVRYGTPPQEKHIIENVNLYGEEFERVAIFAPKGDGLILESNGVIIAEYHEDYNELSILFDIFGVYSDKRVTIFRELMKDFNEKVWKRIELRNSWLHTSDKSALTGRFMDRFKRQRQEQLNEDKHRLTRYENNIQDYKRKIKENHDQLIRLRQNIQVEEANLSDVDKKLIHELDLIVKHPKISDLHIKDGKFIVYTPNIYAHTPNGKRYYIGNMRTEIQLDNADIRFFGDNPRQGFWENDPHPHVSGREGVPCLGNTSSTIAELASRNEIYALALVCIDFLESANPSDPAGAKIVLWDEVDDDGNVLREGGHEDDEDREIDFTCECCDEPFFEDEDETAHTVYNAVDEDGNPSDERTVCENCRNINYHYSNHYEAYMHDDIEEPTEDDE